MRTPGFWERIDTPTKVIGGVIATAALVVTTYIAVAGNPWATSAPDQQAQTNTNAVASRQVQRCLKAHGMKSPRVSVPWPNMDDLKKLTFRRCEWPPRTDTSTDGYSEIVDYDKTINQPNAAEFNTIDRIAAPCDEIKITYVYEKMGTRSFVPSKQLERGQLYLVTFRAVKRLDQIPREAARYVPIGAPSDARTFFVLHSADYVPFDAACDHGR